MDGLAVPRASIDATPEQLITFVIAYATLLTARWEAREQNIPAHQHRVNWAELEDRHVELEVLLWMLYQAHVEHLPEGAGQSTDAAGLTIGVASTFCLTEVGEAFALLFLSHAFSDEDHEFNNVWNLVRLGSLTPRYDSTNRVFTWGQHVLKRYRQPSLNQEQILQAAEELNWIGWFDDPLPGVTGVNPKVRLHDTIKDLNRRQTPHLVHFMGDGTGTRVGWMLR